MLRLLPTMTRSRAAYRAASYALAIALVAGAHAAIGAQAARIFA
ncbi:MAG: hypothetical protein ACREH4_02220 [Vitreimonas sp.]